MEKRELFKEAFERYGKPVSFHELPPSAGDGLREFLRFFNSILANPAVGTGVYCDWIENTRFNAVASTFRDQELIGIFWGAAISIYSHFSAFLCDPSVLPSIGNTSIERPDEMAVAALRDGSFVMNATPRGPADPTRYKAAQHLAWNAVMWIFFHELAHIMLCHPRLILKTGVVGPYIELPNFPMSAQDAHLRLLLEVDADENAAKNNLSHLRLGWDRGFFPALSSAGFELSWSLSIAMLFHIMDSRLSPEVNPAYRTHPPPFVRLLHAVSIGITPGHKEIVGIGSEEPANLAFDAVRKWWRENDLRESAHDHGLGQDPVDYLNDLRDELSSTYASQLIEYQQERAKRQKQIL